mgnify:CR=1 FL=1
MPPDIVQFVSPPQEITVPMIVAFCGLTGDMQDSLRTRRPVSQDLGEFVPATLELSVFALAVIAVTLEQASTIAIVATDAALTKALDAWFWGAATGPWTDLYADWSHLTG